MLADRMAQVSPFLAMEVLDRVKDMESKGINIVHMQIGEPDFATPACVIDACGRALNEGHTHYTHSLGDANLREALCAYFKRRYKVAVEPGQVLIFSGTSPALMTIFAALLNPGDEVIVSNPAYACYKNFVRFPGGKVVENLTFEEDGFQFRPDDVKKSVGARTKAIIINSPCNPTGILLEPQRMAELAELGPLVVSDEIYHGLTYDGGPEHSILEFTDNAVVIGGFSKAWAMTGWRLGYLIVPRGLVRPLQTLMQNFFVSPNAAAQRAGITAIEQCDDDVARMRDIYNQRRLFMLDGLKKLGFRIPVEPRGAFYILVNARHLGGDSLALAYDILEKAHVGVTPGIDFGTQSEGFLRFSYANSMENLAEGLRRLGEYIGKR